MKRIKLKYNLSDLELEEVLEKALTSLRNNSSETPDSPLPSKHAERLRKESLSLFNKVMNNMIKEIQEVIKKGDK